MGRAVVSAPITLGMLVMLFLCLSLQNLWRVSFGPFLHWLSGLGIKAGHGLFKIDIHPFRVADTINVEVQKVLSQGIAMAEKNFVRFLNYTVEPFLLVAGVTLALGLSAYEGFDALWHHVTKVAPRVIHQTIVRPVKNTVHVIDSRLTARVNTLTHRLDALRSQVAHAAHATAGAIASPFPRIGRLEREVANQGHRLKTAEKALALGASAALVLTALKRLGLGWLRCSNVTKTGKAVCGMDARLLESLLFDALALTVAFNLRTFAEELQDVTKEAADLIHRFAD